MIVAREKNKTIKKIQLLLLKDEGCNEKERTQGERDSQTTLSFGCSVPMSAAKTDSPFIYALVLFSSVRGSIKYAEILRVSFTCAKVRGITEESVSLRGIGRAGCWGSGV